MNLPGMNNPPMKDSDRSLDGVNQNMTSMSNTINTIHGKATRQDVLYERRISKVQGESAATGWQGILVKINKSTTTTNTFMGELVKHFEKMTTAKGVIRDNAKEDKEEKTFYKNRFLKALQEWGAMSGKRTVFGNIIEALLGAIEKITLAGMVVLGGLLATAWGEFGDKIEGVWNNLKTGWDDIWKNITDKGWAMWNGITAAFWKLAKPLKPMLDMLYQYISTKSSAGGIIGGILGGGIGLVLGRPIDGYNIGSAGGDAIGNAVTNALTPGDTTPEQDIKPGAIRNGNYVHPAMAALGEFLRTDPYFPGGRGTITAENDLMHNTDTPTSKHNEGLAMDFRLRDPSKSAEAEAYLRELLKTLNVSGRVLDEYVHRSPHWTGPHMHIQFSTPEDANKFLQYYYTTKNPLRPDRARQPVPPAKPISLPHTPAVTPPVKPVPRADTTVPVTTPPAKPKPVVLRNDSTTRVPPQKTSQNTPPMGMIRNLDKSFALRTARTLA